MWRPLAPSRQETSSASVTFSACKPVPTARANSPSRAAVASSATATSHPLGQLQLSLVSSGGALGILRHGGPLLVDVFAVPDTYHTARIRRGPPLTSTGTGNLHPANMPDKTRMAGAATRDENRVSPAKLGSPWCGRTRCYAGDFRFRRGHRFVSVAGDHHSTISWDWRSCSARVADHVVREPLLPRPPGRPRQRPER